MSWISEFSQIRSNLYLGDISDAGDYETLINNKIKLIVNCTEDISNFFEDMENNPFKYLRCPMEDLEEVDIQQHFDTAHAAILETIQNGGSVLVHCRGGVSRSATIIISYLIKHEKMTLMQAYNHTRTNRRIIGPNIGFWDKLMALEIEIHGVCSLDAEAYLEDQQYL
jgi:protein-tyrosine phosphatase